MPDQNAARSYVVVRVDGDTLTVVGAVTARNQEQAIDVARDSLAGNPVSSPDYNVYGAFLKSSYREIGIEAQPSVVIHKTPRKRTFPEVKHG